MSEGEVRVRLTRAVAECAADLLAVEFERGTEQPHHSLLGQARDGIRAALLDDSVAEQPRGERVVLWRWTVHAATKGWQGLEAHPAYNTLFDTHADFVHWLRHKYGGRDRLEIAEFQRDPAPVPEEQEARACPTCGSGDPKVCALIKKPREHEPHPHGGEPTPCCVDPFHSPPPNPEQKQGERSDYGWIRLLTMADLNGLAAVLPHLPGSIGRSEVVRSVLPRLVDEQKRRLAKQTDKQGGEG